MSRRRPTFAESVPGAESHTEVVCRVVAWAQSLRSTPTARQFADRWGMTRCTAWRYRRAIINAGLLQQVEQ